MLTNFNLVTTGKTTKYQIIYKGSGFHFHGVKVTIYVFNPVDDVISKMNIYLMLKHIPCIIGRIVSESFRPVWFALFVVVISNMR